MGPVRSGDSQTAVKDEGGGNRNTIRPIYKQAQVTGEKSIERFVAKPNTNVTFQHLVSDVAGHIVHDTSIRVT